jgi:hypothetical protein
MSLRRRDCLLFALVLISATALTIWATRPPRVNPGRFARVEKGMTRPEVYQAVGGPPGDYGSGPVQTPPGGLRFSIYEEWLCDDAQLLVRFDLNNRVSDIAILEAVPLRRPSLIDRLRRKLGL